MRLELCLQLELLPTQSAGKGLPCCMQHQVAVIVDLKWGHYSKEGIIYKHCWLAFNTCDSGSEMGGHHSKEGINTVGLHLTPVIVDLKWGDIMVKRG